MSETLNQEKQAIYYNFISFLESLKNNHYFVAENSWFFRYDIYFDRENDLQVHLLDTDKIAQDPLFLSLIQTEDTQLKDKLFVHLDLIERSNKELDQYILKNNKEQEENNEEPTPLVVSSNSFKLTTLLNYSFEDAKRAYNFYFIQLLNAIKESTEENYMFFDSVELIRNPYFSQKDALNFEEYKNFMKYATKFQKDVFISYMFLANAKTIIKDSGYSINDIFDVFIHYTNNDYTYQNMRLMDIYRQPFSLSTVEYIFKLPMDYIKNYDYPSSFSNKEEFIESVEEIREECLEKYSIAQNMVNF